MALLVVLGVLVAFEVVDETRGGFLALAVVAAMILFALPLERFSELESLKIAEVEISFAQKAAEEATSADATEEDTRKAGEEDEIADLQVLLEAKLTYVAKHVIGFEGTGHWAPFLTLGSLQYDEYMSKEDVAAARELLSLREGWLNEAGEDQRRAYIERIAPVVRNVRASIFHEVVKRVLIKDFKVALMERERGGKKKPDLVLDVAGPGRAVVFPAFSGGGGYWNSDRIAKRAKELAKSGDPALIVVPPNARAKDPGVKGVNLVRLDELVEAGRVRQAPKKRLALERLIFGREPDGT